MKKEGGQSTQEIEKQYDLEKYEKTEFVKQIIKEFWKYGKKLQKIGLYEEMKREKKSLNMEMLDLLTKKESFASHLDSLKQALEIYDKTLKKSEEPVVVQKDPKVEIQEKIKEFCDMATKKLGYFFTIAATLADKEKVDPSPLANLPVAQQSALVKAYKDIVHIQEEKDTTLAEEALRSSKLISQILGTAAGDENVESLKNAVENVMGDTKVTSHHYKLVVPKVIQIEKEYSVNPVISIGKHVAPEIVKKEIPAPAPAPAPVVVHEKPVEVKEVPKAEEEVEPVKRKPLPEVKKEEDKKKSWDEIGDEEEEYEPDQKPVDQQEPKEPQPQKEEEEEDEFTTATSKGEERKKKLEEEKKRMEEARYSGRRRGRYRQYAEGQTRRGYRRGGYRDRGEARGTYASYQ